MLDDYLTPAQTARVLGITPQRVGQLCRAGRLAHVRTPLGRLIARAVVEDFALGRGIRFDETR